MLHVTHSLETMHSFRGVDENTSSAALRRLLWERLLRGPRSEREHQIPNIFFSLIPLLSHLAVQRETTFIMTNDASTSKPHAVETPIRPWTKKVASSRAFRLACCGAVAFAAISVLLGTVSFTENSCDAGTNKTCDTTTSNSLTKILEGPFNFLGVDTYRLKTRLSALYSLTSISERSIDKYIGSYILFDGDWSNKNGKSDSHIVDYYHVLNHLCALGNVEKMYVPPVRDPKASLTRNQDLFELKMMEDIGAFGPNKKLLDIGCGRGRVAMHVATTTGNHVSGINIDPSQIANAKEFAARSGFADNTHFQVSSLNDRLPFPDGTLDAAYEIQAFTYMKNKDAVFSELYRVLKPGAKFSYLDWVLLDNYDYDNATHVDLVESAILCLGAVDTIRYQEIEEAMKKAGFKVLLSKDASIDGHQASLINSERGHYWWLRFIARAILPKRFMTMLKRLRVGCESLQVADELRLSTTSYQIVCQKPED